MGLYDPSYEHDACGFGLVARLDARPSHEVVDRGLLALDNLEHRGAEGADPETGDGAGILIQLPHAFLSEVVDAELPPPGRYGVGMCFLPPDPARRAELERLVEQTIEDEGQRVLAWRDVPVDARHAGRTALEAAPVIRQVVVGAAGGLEGMAFERKLYVIRRITALKAGPDFVFPSFSSRTVVYKGMLTAPQLPRFYPDLRHPRFASALALVHSRFSTNTFPSWELAHPYRLLAHNGEINALRGNVNWMRARESALGTDAFGDDLEKVLPVVRPGGSDSASFDNVLELLTLAGRSLPHALMMMMPEAYQGRRTMPPELRGFYAYHGCLIEPWDGPAAIAATDGTVACARLDRNGLRPGRWVVTRDGWVVLASEVGVLPFAEHEIEAKGRLHPGKLFVIDLERRKVVPEADVELEVATRRPYRAWYTEHATGLADLEPAPPVAHPQEPLHLRQLTFGYSQEDLRILLAPMAIGGAEPTGSMGADVALPVFSMRQPPLFSYFKQLFAQVTNPPIDPIREQVVMSLTTLIGEQRNLFDETPEHARQIVLDHPLLRDAELERLRAVREPGFQAHTIDMTWPVAEGPEGLEAAVDRICAEAREQVEAGVNVLILSDRGIGPERVAIPSLLATAAVHHHLVREGIRLRAGLVLETGEPREVHHMATLIGYGATAINPYLAFETLELLRHQGKLNSLSSEEAQEGYIRALNKGLLKIISKMGISTIQSYRGAQIFEAVGLDRSVIDRHFVGTASRIGGIGMEVIGTEAIDRHARAYPEPKGDILPVGGIYQWRRDGEFHAWNPDTIAALQHAVGTNTGGRSDQQRYDEYSRLVNEETQKLSMIRGLLAFREDVTPVPIDEVEPAIEIVKRFSTGGMSLGALSPEAHETLAVAMNRLGSRSNTGEGGEDPRRFRDERRSAIKQVASGRFGVTINYLVNADELQIKVAQGAKPGEGGQLPGHKVDHYIAGLRHSTPGVGLISPPPHHDIYSIEDLKQLIYDLRCANPRARVSVKLVAEIGVGTVAAGVAKANADHVVIAGHDGGTGASPQSSIQSAGVPWEIGLAETQQTLLLQDLRSRITVEVDGQMRTGRDVVIGAILGADEFGFSTAPLIATGCIMMRVCHLNTCPVGVASQDPVLRARFAGTPDHVVQYLMFVAEEARALMASLGVRRLDELIGHTELLHTEPVIDHWKARGIDLSEILAMPEVDASTPRHQCRPQEPVLDDAIDWELIEACRPAIDRGEPVRLERPIRNGSRCVGGLLSNAITRAHGADGLPEATIGITFTGSAGQSFAGWLARGVDFTLLGDANDYTGKGLSGGTLVVHPPDGHRYRAEENVVVGNTVLYGATGGRAFFRGLAGERFAVRNSGALAVVEGVGDHGCEYMTGGRVVVLGPTGLNFAAGMSGGIAYVLDLDGTFEHRCNHELVALEDVDDFDAFDLRNLILEHHERTGSPVAEHVLSDFDALRERFAKVMPRDFKRALDELEPIDVDITPAGEPYVGAGDPPLSPDRDGNGRFVVSLPPGRLATARPVAPPPERA